MFAWIEAREGVEKLGGVIVEALAEILGHGLHPLSERCIDRQDVITVSHVLTMFQSRFVVNHEGRYDASHDHAPALRHPAL